ncbi:CCA tRNA nucleotidyltransferase, mitochondrial [Marasmius tenuissimus]|uniref:CCA tRNA nucleotidyltransferase, mitochondrial n=1 Tax=Marasmius tenuissimus TaxID=585030 RepID=A0ABR2ZR91_9AGAR
MAALIPLRTSKVNRILIPEEMNVELTETEEKICELLDQCTEHLRKTKGIHTECRIAGGWVRDKLLGSQSNDIDVALTDIMGYAFAEHLAEFAQAEGMTVGSIGKIAQNPDQSKHLETATFRILDRDIDLVNLRSEEYASASRIPTGVGLDDLKNAVVRTPLSPKETFIDDPLRVLRCIRFASRFGFDIVPEIVAAVQDPEIKEALVSKVARERAGEELSKMVKGRDPLRSIQLITSLGLYSSIFSGFPPNVIETFSDNPRSEATALKAASILQTLLANVGTDLPPLHPTFFKVLESDVTCKPRLFLAAVLSPYAGIIYRDHKGKELPVVEYVIRECLKLGSQNHFLDGIPALFSACNVLRNPDPSDQRLKTPSERAAVGLLLREKSVHNVHTGSHWTSSLLFSLVQELVSFCNDVEQGLTGEYSPHAMCLTCAYHRGAAEDAIKTIRLYNTFIQRVEELGLFETVDAKPLLDGREVSSALDARPGPWTGAVLAKVVVWQLENPQGTKDDCLTWLKGEREQGNIEVANNRPPDSKPVKKARTRK